VGEPVVVGAVLLERDAPLYGDAASGEMRGEQLFGDRLGDEQQERERRVADTDVEQLCAHHSATRMDPELHSRVAPRNQLVRHAEGAQDLQGARLHSQGT